MPSDVSGAAPTRKRSRSAPTIYDVARLAGVNPSTVSRALSQPGRINVKTEAKIHAAAKELNYRLNPMARALPTGKTNTLGLLIADITNPVIFGIVRGAERAAARHGYTLVVTESQESGSGRPPRRSGSNPRSTRSSSALLDCPTSRSAACQA